MIDFELGDELALIRETARGFADDHLRPRDREFESDRAVAGEVHEAFREIGLDALELPEEFGGAGLGALARALVLEELAAADPGAALALDPLGPALYPLLELGGKRALESLARPLLERPGDAVCAERALERADHRLGRIRWQVAVAPLAVGSELEHGCHLVVCLTHGLTDLPGAAPD